MKIKIDLLDDKRKLTSKDNEEKIRLYKLKLGIKKDLSYAERIAVINGNTFPKFNSKPKKKKNKKKKYDKKDKGKKVTRRTKLKARKEETFYESRQWRELRYAAFKLHGRQCLCCGAKPPGVELHVDHIKPRSLFPDLVLDINNLQILCKDCNLGKSNYDCIDYRINKP